MTLISSKGEFTFLVFSSLVHGHGCMTTELSVLSASLHVCVCTHFNHL